MSIALPLPTVWVAWLLIQIATQVFPFFDIPNWTVRFVIVVLLLGFPWP